MQAYKIQHVIEKDGELVVKNLPCKKGQTVEMILLVLPGTNGKKHRMTAKALLRSGLVGLWSGRDDIKDSSSYARTLRTKVQR
ncbi:MAG: hypothetical protein HY960_12115 [Ignavibacteriae bacterium]|nr:hypothetical protein [Ignavibacteriota bacterium]